MLFIGEEIISGFEAIISGLKTIFLGSKKIKSGSQAVLFDCDLIISVSEVSFFAPDMIVCGPKKINSWTNTSDEKDLMQDACG